jgi:hypothetical protein
MGGFTPLVRFVWGVGTYINWWVRCNDTEAWTIDYHNVFEMHIYSRDWKRVINSIIIIIIIIIAEVRCIYRNHMVMTS